MSVPRSSDDSIKQREASFHDDIAASVIDCPPRASDHLELALLESVGDIRACHVLELGCGHGDLTMQLIDAGAHVVATDLSPGMVDAARRRIARHRPNASARVVSASAEDIPFQDRSFDLVVGKWIIHHVDVAAALQETARVLRPGGTAAFIENSGMNAVLRFARDHLVGRVGIPRLGTVDEHPLMANDYALFEEVFSEAELIWPDFYFLRLLDRQVFRQHWPVVSRAARSADDLVYRRVRRLRKRSFHVLVLARKSAL